MKIPERPKNGYLKNNEERQKKKLRIMITIACTKNLRPCLEDTVYFLREDYYEFILNERNHSLACCNNSLSSEQSIVSRDLFLHILDPLMIIFHAQKCLR